MAGTGGVRKVRFAPPSSHAGKRGGLRVAYAYVRVADVIYLLDVFAKNEQANFTAAEKATMRRLAAALADLHCRPLKRTDWTRDHATDSQTARSGDPRRPRRR